MSNLAAGIPRRTFLATAIAGLSMTSRGAASSLDGDDIVTIENPVDYLVTHCAQFVPGDMNPLTLEIWIPVPMSDREQIIANVQVPAMMRLLDEETKTTKVARYNSRDMRGVPDKLEVSYSAQVSALRADIDKVLATRWPEPEKTPAPSTLYTRKETAIQIDDARIKAKAAELHNTADGPGLYAQAAYNWVLDQTEYRRFGVLKGARFCFEKHEGECGDYTALFVALCRAAKIPARPAVGILLDGKPNSTHVWAEFQIPSGEWVPVDCSMGDGGPRQRKAHFGIKDNKRLALAKTFDVKLKKPSKGRDKVEILQSGSWWYTGQGGGVQARCDFSVIGKPAAEQSQGKA